MRELGQSAGVEGLVSPEAGRRHMFIVLMGMPSSGKSTLGTKIKTELGFAHLRELPPKEVNGFQDYYRNPDRFSYAVQVQFLEDCCRKMARIPALLRREGVVLETPHWEHRFFASLRLAARPELLSEYERLYSQLTRGLPSPDLIIYLQLSLLEMDMRLKDRSKKETERKVEVGEKPEFWKKLLSLHEEWVRLNSENGRIITIKGDRFNFVRLGGEEKGKNLLYEEFVNQVRYACFDGEARRIPGDFIIPPQIEKHRPKSSR